jgi:alanyl-tRNA synthetase
MADTPAPAPEAPAEGAQPSQEPATQGQPQDSKSFNITELPKEAWEQIYKSDRFKQLNEKAKQAETLLKEKAEAERAALEQNGEWQKLAEAAKSEVETIKQSTIAAEIKAFAAKAGAVDINDVAALADKAAVKIEGGVVSGAEEAVQALVEAKPHLFNKTNQQPRVGSGTNPGDANNQGVPKFTMSQIKDPAFWQAHEADILQAFKNGTVVDDTK